MEEPDDLLVEAVEKLKGPQQAFSLTVVSETPAAGKYENYGSRIIRLKLKAQTKEGRETITVIKKTKKEEETQEDYEENVRNFKIEILAYEKILSAMEEMMVKVNELDGIFWPKCLSSGQMTIFLEDLKASGFNIIPMHKGLSVSHALASLKALGNFHGMGLVLTENKMFDPSTLIPSRSIRGQCEYSNSKFSNALSTLSEVIRSSWEDHWLEVANALSLLKNQMVENLQSISELLKGKLYVINHGDCWSNNFMFKSDEGLSSVEYVRFLDFQDIHYDSLAWDLSDFFFLALFPEVMLPHRGELLSVYVDSLHQSCNKFGFTGKVPSFEEIEEMFKFARFYGLLMCITYMPLIMCSGRSDIDADIDSLAIATEGNLKQLRYKCYKDEKVTKNLKAILTYFSNENCWDDFKNFKESTFKKISSPLL